MDADFLRDPFHASACHLGGPVEGGTDCRAPESFFAKHEIDPALGINFESGQNGKERPSTPRICTRIVCEKWGTTTIGKNPESR